eukprot:2053609-Heterocapsa_arctica.AAC.1
MAAWAIQDRLATCTEKSSNSGNSSSSSGSSSSSSSSGYLWIVYIMFQKLLTWDAAIDRLNDAAQVDRSV